MWYQQNGTVAWFLIDNYDPPLPIYFFMLYPMLASITS